MIREIIEPLDSLVDVLKNEERSIFLYGMGNGAEKIFEYLTSRGVAISGVVASDGFVRGQDFLGFKVISITEASEKHGSLCLVLCFGLEGEKSHFLADLAKKHRLISPNLPVFGEGACDKGFILENAESFERVYEMLADSESKEIFLNILKYNVTGDIAFLEKGKMLDCPKEFYDHEKRHIDVGAYDGDTAIEFAENSDKYSDIIAFEPDTVTFRHFQKNTESIRDCIGINAAVGRYDGKVSFASGNGRASHCEENGDAAVECISIDKYCGFTHIDAKGVPVGSIKIDAEGMDEDVICGAVNTIYCCKPNLAIALYHRAGDLIELPLLIRKHYHKYEFYLRKKEYVPAWDIFLYAIKR
jgi:FkbM family methyltransferase